ncbi:MAG TPA: phenylalanine--tRNA ligase beta subunit-related protein, partial [Thermoanaerobaculia bacterium]|nr:phenylalanine--tRNA ligase beta subunit-related protein [Thermoanaerobaculia bacterium]
MRFSRDWLGDFVELPDDTEELARRLTAAGLAVDTVEKTADVDSVLDIDVTTNRVDAMNHLGLAREIAVLYGLPLREPAAAVPEGGEETTAAVRVAIEDPELCSRYVARVVRGVAVGPSPDWLARRLRAIGQRPINNVVDATNYVLWELGQPLHGFDLAQIAGAEIRVRRARAGETLVTLDGEERKLTPEMLVIADSGHPVALAGVMGGEQSEVGPGTKDVLLESAWFDPRSVRATAKALGMHTDACHRFERGVDPELQARAAARAAALVAEAGGGT